MDQEAVQGYVEESQTLLESSPQLDEANTKAAILRDLLELLGWKIPSNTQLEYSVEAFGQTYKVDYALILESTPVAFLEAKGADTALTSDHSEQLSSYMTNKNVNYGILTNGWRYRFFQRRVDASQVNVETVGEVELQSLPDRHRLLEAFTADAIQSGEAGNILGRIIELREARTILEAEKDELALDLTNVLTEGVSDTISSFAESQSKEAIDRLIDEIENEIDSSATFGTGESSTTTVVTSDTAQSENPENDYLINLMEDGISLAQFSSNVQADVMAEVVDHLIENHELISQIEPLPYVPGRNKAVINEQPTYLDEEKEMVNYRELTNGYYLDTHSNKKGKKRHIRQLAQHCDIEVVFDGKW